MEKTKRVDFKIKNQGDSNFDITACTEKTSSNYFIPTREFYGE